jgi:hypothetical protein
MNIFGTGCVPSRLKHTTVHDYRCSCGAVLELRNDEIPYGRQYIPYTMIETTKRYNL